MSPASLRSSSKAAHNISHAFNPRIPLIAARAKSPQLHQVASTATATATATPRSTPPQISRPFFFSTTTTTTQSPKMSTAPAQHGHSEACCNVPPVVAHGYKAKGSYEEIGGYKTYVTGPSDATKAIVVIYDIFGYFDQTVQGADILAHSDSHQKYKVYIPDWFNGKPCPIEIFPPDNKEKEEQLGNFFQTYPPPSIAGKVPDYVKAIQQKDSSVAKFGILGYCWGGKVVALTTKADSNPFSIAASIHPAMVDAEDAKGVKIPTLLLASKDEDVAEVKKFEEALTVAKYVETFPDQIHGWMAARSNLDDARVKEEYERGYKTVLNFFSKNF